MKTPFVMGAVETVTPELAAEWLEANPRNRKINQRHVSALAVEIRAGRWLVTGEAIKLTADGQLLDGQHRLWAVLEAGMPIRTMVVRGIQSEAQLVMDTGAARKPGQGLGLLGYANANATAAALSVLARCEARTYNPRRLTAMELDAVAKRWGVERVASRVTIVHRAPHGLRTAAVTAACVLADAAHGRALSDALAVAIASGQGPRLVVQFREGLLRAPKHGGGDGPTWRLMERLCSLVETLASGRERHVITGSRAAIERLTDLAVANLDPKTPGPTKVRAP